MLFALPHAVFGATEAPAIADGGRVLQDADVSAEQGSLNGSYGEFRLTSGSRSVIVESDTLTAVADGDYLASKARLSVYLTQAVSVPVTVTVTPQFEDGHAEPWGDYVRFHTTLDTVQTLPSSNTAPTVTIPAGSTAKKYIYVYTLRGDEHTIGDGHQVQFVPSISAADSAASGIDMANMSAGAMWIRPAKPVITSPKSTDVYEVTSGEELEINVAVNDTCADMADTSTGYTVQIKTTSLASWVELTEKFSASGEDGELLGLTTGKPPTITYNGSGDYVSQVRVKAPVSGKTSEITYFNVHVAAGRTAGCSTTNGGDDNNFFEGDTVQFRVDLSVPNDTPSTIYAFLLSNEDIDLDMFGGTQSKCIIKDASVAAPTSVGRPIAISGTSTTGRFTVLDGDVNGLNYTFSVVLCSKRNYDPAYRIAGYPTTEMINIMVYNKEPVINTMCVNGFESESDGYTFPSYYFKGQNITIKSDIDDVAYELTHGFQYKWTASRNGEVKASGTVGHATGSDTIVAEGTSISDASFTYNFPQEGTWTVTIQALDKDMIANGTSWIEAPTYSFNLNIVNYPQLMVERDKTICETNTNERLTIGIGYYDADEPIVVKVTVSPPTGDNPGKLTFANQYKTVPAGYEMMFPDGLAENEYLVSFTDANDQELVIASLDGTRLSSVKGFTVKAEVITPTESIVAGKSWSEIYWPYSAKIYIENIAPVLGNVTKSYANAWNTYGPAATDYPITWEVRGDVDADFTTLWADNSGPGVRVKFTGCENPESERVRYVTTPFFGTFVPNFGSRQGLQTVVLTIEDKDGGSHRFEYKYFVRASKFLTTIAHGPSSGTASSRLSVKYNNAGGLGEGHTWVEGGIFAGANSFRLKWNCLLRQIMKVYGWGYKTTDPVDDGDLDGTARYQHDIPIDPRGNNATAGNVALSSYYSYNDAMERDSYLYTWLLNTVDEKGVMESQILGSLSPELAGAGAAAAIVPLPTEPVDEEDDSFAETYVEAVFSKEWRPLDNCGDINADGIPDRIVVKYGFGVYNPDSGELAGDDLANVVSFNDDEDYLPGGYEGGNALTPNVSGSWSSQGGAFHAFYELRGFGPGLNAGYPNPDGSDPAPDYSSNEKRAWMLWKGVDDGDGNPVTEAGLKDMSDGDVETLFAANVADARADLKLANGSNGANGWSPERSTDPTLADTDGDDLPDGYEYWFWYGAKVGYSRNNNAGKLVWDGRMTGKRLDRNDIEHFVTIPADEIVSAFDPLMNGGVPDEITGVSIRTRDFDNDGLSDYEEMLIGTNPVNCDTDGDGIPDGYSGFTNVTIPDGVTSIQESMFKGCSGFMSVTIPDSITNIGEYAFSYCSGLTNVIFNGNAPTVGDNAFYRVGNGCTVYVRKDSIGWGVDIPGTWNGMRIEYIEEEPDTNIAMLAQSVNAEELAWTTGGAVRWMPEWVDDAADGLHQAKCGAVPNGTNAWLATTVEGPGTLAFKWRSVLASRNTKYQFMVDGEVKGMLTGTNDWTEVSITVFGDRTHEIKWRLMTGRSGSSAGDWVALDCVVWTPTVPPTLAEALNTNLVWTTEGDVLWRGVARESLTDSRDAWAVVSGLGDDGTSAVQTRVYGSGILFFDWAISCEEDYDWMELTVDGEVRDYISGSSDWTQSAVEIVGDGWHVVRWRYIKDELDEPELVGENVARLDNVVWSSDDVAPMFTETQTTPVPVPYSELETRFKAYLDAASGDYEAAAHSTGLNGYAIWECYVAGLEPDNPKSKFIAKIEMVDGKPVVTWEPNLNEDGVVRRLYKIHGSETLENGGNWQYPTNSLHHFFKVTVEMP